MKNRFLIVIAIMLVLSVAVAFAACKSGTDNNAANGGNSSSSDGNGNNGGSQGDTGHQHTWGEWTTIPSGHALSEQAATKHIRACSGCSEYETQDHAFGDWATITEETEENEGLKTRTCSVCGYIEEKAIPVHVHTYGEDMTYDDIGHWYPATCSHDVKGSYAAHTFGAWVETKAATTTEEGEEKHTCSVCGFSEVRAIPVVTLTYEAVGTSSVAVVGLADPTLTEVVIPATYQGKKVVKIKSLTSSVLRSLVVGPEVTEITGLDCANLTEITLSKATLKYVTFNCPMVDKIYFDGTLEDYLNASINTSNWTIGSHELYLKQEGEYQLLTDLVVPTSVKSIRAHAFTYNKGLLSAVIPSHVTNIGTEAFYHCDNLKTLDVRFTKPDALNFSVFDSSPIEVLTVSLQTVLVNKGSYFVAQSLAPETVKEVTIVGDPATFSSSDFYCGCSNLTKVTIASSVGSVPSYSFARCPILTTVVLEEGVSSINQYAFEECPSITSFVATLSLSSIGEGAFDVAGHSRSVDIYSLNSFEAWADVEIGSGALIGHVYYYSEEAAFSPLCEYWHYDQDGKPVLWQAQD